MVESRLHISLESLLREEQLVTEKKGVIYETGAWNIGEIKGSSAMPQAYEMGKMHRVKGVA
jgi:CRISPR/Cas system-associated exonuclease Cas4 (RecB family)